MGLKMLERNKRAFFYANLMGSQEILDINNTRTGEYENTYTEPILARGNISPDRGETSINPFGIGENYQRILQLEDENAPLSETTILWVDDLDTSKPHDYIVVGVARSLESSKFALRKVNVGQLE